MNDKQKARWEEVREAYAKVLRLGPSDAEWYIALKKANKLLSLKDSKGYLVEMADLDQSVIDNEIWHKVDREYEAYCAGQNTMAGRIKIIPREG